MIRVDKKKLIPVLSCSLNKVNNDSGYDVDNNFCTTTMIMTFSVYYRKIPKNKPLQVEARQSNNAKNLGLKHPSEYNPLGDYTWTTRYTH